MKKNYSLIALLLVFSTFILFRFAYPKELGDNRPLQVTTWDALGYYMYLPGTFIYEDMDQYAWFPAIDEQYGLSGGHFYQAGYDKELDVYVTKYLGGLAVLQLPFFTGAHLYAKNTSLYPADGFSLPYQVAVCIGALFYMLIGFWFLRKILLHYFDDRVTTITLLLIGLTTNIIQYAAIDSAMSHSYIFFMYPLVIWTTIKWHANPTIARAALIGWLIGAATICRPTEALMILIPLLWATHTKTAAKEKWKLVWANKKSIYSFILFGFLGILPQLVYWQIITGFPIYAMGSKWFFLTPWFRVLFGINNGWFIYTPIAIAFIVGLFFMKDRPFRKSVIWFSLLTIWVVIAWSDWRYGATYSCRALSQSLAVFALPLACIIERIVAWRYKLALLPVGLFMIYMNVVQIHQYNSTVLHYHDMNWKYYGAIFLDPTPGPLALSLLDNNDLLEDPSGFRTSDLTDPTKSLVLPGDNSTRQLLLDTAISIENELSVKEWITIATTLKLTEGFYGGSIHAELIHRDSIRHTKIRIANPVAKIGKANNYVFHLEGIDYLPIDGIKLYVESSSAIRGTVEKLEVKHLRK